MSTTSATLPPDWSEFLVEVHRHVRQAIADADARLERSAAGPREERAQDSSDQGMNGETRFQGLSSPLASADQLVSEVDVSLLASEQALRQHGDSCASVRQKLAEWAGRAIG